MTKCKMYNKFIPSFATVVQPLRQCFRHDNEFSWSEDAQNSFETVKKLLVESPALALFNPDLPTIVTTDAPDYGLGAVLSQIQPNHTERTSIIRFAIDRWKLRRQMEQKEEQNVNVYASVSM